MASEVTLTQTVTETLTQAAPPSLLPPPSSSVLAQQGDDVVLTIPLAPESGVPTKVVWTRGGRDDPLAGDRFSSSTQRGAVTLTVRNATVEDAGRYALTAHNDTGQARSDILLEVRTRPGDVPVFLRRLNDLAVKVGTRTRFLVEIRSPTQVKVSWEQEGKPVLEGERFHLLHEGSFFCVDVAPVTLEDAGLWMCRAHNSNGTATCFCHLNVLVPKAYKAPHFIEELVAILTEQGTVSLECKVVGVPTPTLKWFKDNQEIKAGDVFALSANPQDSTSLGTYTCEATNCMGKAYSTSKVHVINKEGTVQPIESLVPRGPAPVFSKELQNEKVKIGGKLTLVCKVKVPPWPKSICWFNKEGAVEAGGRYHVMEDGLGAYSVEASPVEATDDGEWKCVATSNSGNKTISTCNVTVNYPKNYKKPKFLESLKAILTEEGLVSFECKVVGFPTPQLRWFKDGQELKPGDVYQLTGTNSLGSYCCIAKNCMGETSSTAELTVEDIQSQLNEEERLQLFSSNQPPRFTQGLKSIEAKINDPLRFSVQVSVSPQPTVSWYRDDEEVQDCDRVKREQETKGVCHLSIKRLELADQAEWKCVATNDYGQSVTSCFLKLIVPRHYKKPRFLENLRAILSEEGAVNLECKVIGVPQPTLKWFKDGRELKPGDIHRIISGQDGTCCLGTYTCQATNCMGTVSSSASLLGFEDRGQVKTPEPPKPLPPPVLVRQPSLSTIQEERTSQMHDTVTLDERAEVSFSFDGKEVSVSLYETPDLTEEEALQVVEMYAEELSEHISEHNVIELPPMRFVKETSTSGHLLMEAVVIDVSPDYYASAEDRTEADIDEFSITDDNGFFSPPILSPDEMPFEKFTADFLERTLQALPVEQKPTTPIKPPRKRVNGADASDSSYHSFKEAKVSTPEEESSDAFLDALSSEKDKSQKESFVSVENASGIKEVKVEVEKKLSASPPHELIKKQDSFEKPSEGKKLKKKSRSRSKSTEIDIEEHSMMIDSSEKKMLEKRKTSESEKDDDSLREFEKRKSLKTMGKQGALDDKSQIKDDLKGNKSSESEKEDDSLQEYENRKSLSRSEKTLDKAGKGKKHTSDSSGKEDDSLIEYEKSKMSSDGSLDKLALKARPKFPLTKSMSTDSSEKDDAFAMKSELSEQTISRKKRKKSVKKSEKASEEIVDVPPSSEAESIEPEPLKHKKVISTSDLDRMRSMSDLESVGDKSRAQEEDEDRSADFDTAEDSAYDKSEMSVLESLNHSLQEIQKGLAAVGEKIISESSEEPQSAKSSLSFIESLAQPISEIQKSLEEVERRAVETEAGQYSPSSILETLKEPIEELSKTLAVLEQTQEIKSSEESLLKKTGQSLLESVSQPLQELHKELSFIQQQALIETGDETFSEILQSFKPSLMVVEGGVEQSVRELSSKLEDLTEATTILQPTFAHSVEDNLQSEIKQISSEEESKSVIPMTVQEIEESFADTVKSLPLQKEINLKEELLTYSLGLESCMNTLKEKANKAEDSEIRDILMSSSNLVHPLEQFKTVIEKCLMLVVENDKSANSQVKSANIVLKSALESPVHALGSSLHLLEALASAKSDKEIRGLGIKILYKLSFPLEELKTTMKLVENLSEHTCIELLVAPVENLTATVAIINPDASKEGFAENISKEGLGIVKELDTSVGNLTKSLTTMNKSLQPFSSLVSLTSLTKPLTDLQKNLHKLENKIKSDESHTKSETHTIVQDLCKPLQAIRTELSLAQHEIELDNFANLSTDVSQGEQKSPASIVNQPLEQVYKSILTCTEFILSKSPDETLHLRYLLFALNELILPLNRLSTSVTESEQLILMEKPSVSGSDLSMKPVTVSVNELLESLSNLQNHSTAFTNQPEGLVVQAVCALANPLAQVEDGLKRIIGLMHEEDKQVLNINMLKTLADPFKCLQKSLINISEKLETTALSQDIFLELRQPIQELQRSILVIQDQVSFEYGDEPASIESNIITLQSLVNPMTALKTHFKEIDLLISEQTPSTSQSRENKTLHSIIKVSHDLQLKVSSIMIQDNYLSKHSLDSLDMFPIFQDLSSVLRDFEDALKRVDLICQNRKPDVIFHNRLTETVTSFKNKVSDLQSKIILASNKAMKDKKHPVHHLKRGTEEFFQSISRNEQALLNSDLDDESIENVTNAFFNACSNNFKELSKYLENLSGDFTVPEVASGRDSTDISTISSSDTIKDVNTIMEEITHTRESLEQQEISSAKPITALALVKEVQTFCVQLKKAEQNLIENTLNKVNSLNLSKEDERKELITAFSSMKVQLGKIETLVYEQPQVLEPLRHLKYTLEVIQEHLSFGEEISEIYILQNLSGPLKAFKNVILAGAEKSLIESKPTESVSVSTYLERFEKATSDLELGLMKLEHALLNSTGDFSSLKNIDIEVLAHPIEELVHYIHNIEEQSSLAMSETLGDQSSISMLRTLALPIQEIKEGVLEIQEQILLETSGQSPTGKSCASILYEIAKPIRELRSGVALIQEQVVIMEAEPLSDETAASSLKTLAVPIEELKRVLETIVEHQPLVFEPEAKSISEDISILKTIAQPVKELQSKLASIEINQLLEGNVETFSVKENILALAKPIHELQESIAQFENQVALETLGDDISVLTNISLIKRVAKPLLEVAKGIAMISEQQVVEVADLEDNTISELSTLANITDVSMESGVLNVNEPYVMEHGLSFKEDVHVLKQAKATREEQLGVAVTEVQQVVCEGTETLKNNIQPKENALRIVEETCTPVVVEQQLLSQVESLSLDSKTLEIAEVGETTCLEAMQAEIQEPISVISQLSSVNESLTLVQEIEGSLNIAAQGEVQQALSEGESFETKTSDMQKTKVREALSPAFGVQGELQQSLADVESLETEEDTLKSVSIQETSFKIEPEVQMQQALSAVETLSVTEKTLKVAEEQISLKEAVQKESQQVMSAEEALKSVDEPSETVASLLQPIPQEATKVEMQQTMSSAEQLKSLKGETQTAVASQALAQALQVEQQDVLSNVESLSELTAAKQSQIAVLEEAHNVAIQSEIHDFITVAEDVKQAAEGIKAKVVSEPSLSKAAHSDVQKVMHFSDHLQDLKQSLQVKSLEAVPLLKATKTELQEAMNACLSIQSAIPELKTGIESEVQQILSSAQSLDNIEQSLTAKLSNPEDIFIHVGKEKTLSLSEDVSQLDTVTPQNLTALQSSTDTVCTAVVESEIQAFISVAENVKTAADTFRAKVVSEPELKTAVPKEIQQFLNAVDVVVAIKEQIQVKPEEITLKSATKSEIEQMMSACEQLESATQVLQAKSVTEQKVKKAVYSEIQEVLATTGVLEEVQKGLTAKLAQVESLQNIEVVSSLKVVDDSSNVCQPDATNEVSSSRIPKSQEDKILHEQVKHTTIQTQVDEFIEAADTIKTVADSLQATVKIEPNFKREAIQEIQQIAQVAQHIQQVKGSLQAKSSQDPDFKTATQSEIDQVVQACEDLQKAKGALEIKVNKNVQLKEAIQSEMQQILQTTDTIQNFKDAFTAIETQEQQSTASKVAVGKVGEVFQATDVCEILSVVEKLESVTESLTCVISKEPSLNLALESQIQQMLLTSENLKALKPVLANVSSEPSALETVKTEIQQILVAEENLKVIKTVLQAKSILEPDLQIAETVLPTVLESVQNIKDSCDKLQERNILDKLKTPIQSEIKEDLAGLENLSHEKVILKAKSVLESLNIATQGELQQSLTSTFEVEQAVKSGKATSTQEPTVSQKAVKSGVATLKTDDKQEDITTGSGDTLKLEETSMKETLQLVEQEKHEPKSTENIVSKQSKPEKDTVKDREQKKVEEVLKDTKKDGISSEKPSIKPVVEDEKIPDVQNKTERKKSKDLLEERKELELKTEKTVDDTDKNVVAKEKDLDKIETAIEEAPKLKTERKKSKDSSKEDEKDIVTKKDDPASKVETKRKSSKELKADDLTSKEIKSEEISKPKTVRKKSKDMPKDENEPAVSSEKRSKELEDKITGDISKTTETKQKVEEPEAGREDEKKISAAMDVSKKHTDIVDKETTETVSAEIKAKENEQKLATKNERKKSKELKRDEKESLELIKKIENISDVTEKKVTEKVSDELKADVEETQKTKTEYKTTKEGKKDEKEMSAAIVQTKQIDTDEKETTKPVLETKETQKNAEEPKPQTERKKSNDLPPEGKGSLVSDSKTKKVPEEKKIEEKVEVSPQSEEQTPKVLQKEDTESVTVTDKARQVSEETKPEEKVEDIPKPKKSERKKSKDSTKKDKESVAVVDKVEVSEEAKPIKGVEDASKSKGGIKKPKDLQEDGKESSATINKTELVSEEAKTEKVVEKAPKPTTERKRSKDLNEAEKVSEEIKSKEKIEEATKSNTERRKSKILKSDEKVRDVTIDKPEKVIDKSETKLVNNETEPVKTSGGSVKSKTSRKKSKELKEEEKEALSKSSTKLDLKKADNVEAEATSPKKSDSQISTYEKEVSYSHDSLVKEKQKTEEIQSDQSYERRSRRSRMDYVEENKEKKERVSYKTDSYETKREEKHKYAESDQQTPIYESKRRNRLYIDESSTSDYSSESYSESSKIKKSTSYDTKQWEKELLKKDIKDDGLTTARKIVSRKYDAAPSSQETSYQRKETQSKPLFCGRLVDRTAALGSKVKVTCSLTGNPEPTVQWFKDGLPLSTANDPRLHTRLCSGLASLEMDAVKLGDTGRYTCLARNTLGEASTTASIKIYSFLDAAPQPPVFSQQIKDQYRSATDELTVECRVKGFPQPVISWYKDEQLIPARNRYQQTTLTDGTCRLVIHGPEPSDSGVYKCVAENNMLSETITGYVTFEGREKYLADIHSQIETKLPRFTNTVTDHRIREGGTVALQVAIKGGPRAEVTWYRGSEPLPKKSSRFRYLEDSTTGVYSLVMSETSRAEAGTYTCRASNAHGYRDHTVKVEIVSVGMGGKGSRGRPAMFVTRPDTSMAIAVGEDISASFRVSGDPKPKVTWMKNMKDITNNIRTLKETVNDYVRLTLKHATVMDAGTYFMMAKNVYGTDYAFVTVKVKQRARSLTPTGIRTLWSAPDTSTILSDIHQVSRAYANGRELVRIIRERERAKELSGQDYII